MNSKCISRNSHRVVIWFKTKLKILRILIGSHELYSVSIWAHVRRQRTTNLTCFLGTPVQNVCHNIFQVVLYLANDLKILWEQNSDYEGRLWHQTSCDIEQFTVPHCALISSFGKGNNNGMLYWESIWKSIELIHVNIYLKWVTSSSIIIITTVGLNNLNYYRKAWN